MSRGKTVVKLPFSLQQELGIELRAAQGPRGSKKDYSRQHGPKADRVEKPQSRNRGGFITKLPGSSNGKNGRVVNVNPDGTDSEPDRGGDGMRSLRKEPADEEKGLSRIRTQHNQRQSPDMESEDRSQSTSRESSPALVLDAHSRSYKDRLAQDDDEIAALEKRLGLKGRKAGKAFADEGLTDLLEGLDSEDEGRKRKREEREWWERKRKRSREEEVTKDDSASEEEVDQGSEEMSNDDDNFGDVAEDEDDPFASDDTDEIDWAEGEQDQTQPVRVRENPYVPPVAPSPSSAKYIPPSLRTPAKDSDQDLARLKRQVQGHLNKISEVNLTSILNEIEKLYCDNPRQDVTTTLIDLLTSLISNHATLQTTFILLHAAFCSATYKVIGTDFGAELLSRLTERFQHHQHDTANPGKEALNLISFIAHLFTFHLTSSNLIYSYMNLLTVSLTESNTELLLRIIRDCGPQLRSDDPSALKQVVSQTQASAQQLSQPSVRTQFMLETITDLKNNKMRGSTATSAVTKEHITKLRKVLGSLNSSNRTLRATEPLRLTLDDLLNTDKRGKWWLIGASWRGASPPPNNPSTRPSSHNPSAPIDYTSISQHLRLTTPLHLSILTGLLSSPTPTHAFTSLTKLRLKKSQLQAIPHVLLRCAGAEETFNPFYFETAVKLCNGEDSKRFRKGFEFALWSFLRRIGDGNDDSFNEFDGIDANTAGNQVDMREILSTAKLYAELLYTKTPASGLTLSILRPIELPLLRRGSQASLFVEVLFVQILVLCRGKREDVGRVFGMVRMSGAVTHGAGGGVGGGAGVAMGIKMFLKNVVRGSDLLGKEKKVVRKGLRIAMEVLDGSGRGDEQPEQDGEIEMRGDDW